MYTNKVVQKDSAESRPLRRHELSGQVVPQTKSKSGGSIHPRERGGRGGGSCCCNGLIAFPAAAVMFLWRPGAQAPGPRPSPLAPRPTAAHRGPCAVHLQVHPCGHPADLPAPVPLANPGWPPLYPCDNGTGGPARAQHQILTANFKHQLIRD